MRLSVSHGTVLEGPVVLTHELAGSRTLHRCLPTLLRLDALLRRGRVPKRLTPHARGSNRALLVLRTLNALATKKGAKDIAVDLFGTRRVEEDWDHQSDYLRMKTRRLMSKARRLAGGGYLGLLGSTLPTSLA